MIDLRTKKLSFEISEDDTKARFLMPANNVSDGDFWRLILDDGLHTEIPVFSRRQKGKTIFRDGTLTIVYDGVVSENGSHYDVRLTISVEKKGELLCFTPTVENNDNVRVNECFCPLV